MIAESELATVVEAEETVPLGTARLWLAIFLLSILAVAGGAIAFFAFTNPGNKDMLTTLITGLFSPVVALVGGVTGFYFGSRSEDEAT